MRALLTIFSSGGIKAEPGLDQEAVEEAGPDGIRLSRVFTSAVSCSVFRLVRLASDRFRFGQATPAGFSWEAYGGGWQAVSHERAAIS